VTDEQTDRQNPSAYYSALHCEQCGRAVKTGYSSMHTEGGMYQLINHLFVKHKQPGQ